MQNKIAVVGLGYVGMPLAVEFGKIFVVTGYDINTQRIAELNAGYDRTLERSQQVIQSAKFLKFSSDKNDLRDSNVYIITVPTPIDSSNNPDLSALEAASKLVGRFLKIGDVVIYESTVYPGATEEICVPILEQVSNLGFNKDFYCGYSPERINPGDKIHTLTNTVKITSGSTPVISKFVDELYQNIIDAGTWRAPTIKVAEAAKVIENSQRDLNIAFVNELSIIFKKMNIDTLEVLDAAGTKWNFLPFRPGLVGGHCIGVDPYYLTFKAGELGYKPKILLAGREINDGMAEYTVRQIVKILAKKKVDLSSAKIGLFGFSFKDNCPDIRNTKAFQLITELEEWGCQVSVYDPQADPSDVENEYGIRLNELSSMQSLDVAIFTVAHKEFEDWSLKYVKSFFKASGGFLLADLKGIFNTADASDLGFSVYRL